MQTDRWSCRYLHRKFLEGAKYKHWGEFEKRADRSSLYCSCNFSLEFEMLDKQGRNRAGEKEEKGRRGKKVVPAPPASFMALATSLAGTALLGILGKSEVKTWVPRRRMTAPMRTSWFPHNTLQRTLLEPGWLHVQE